MPVDVKLILDVKDAAWITAHATDVFDLNEPIYRDDGFVAYGDNVTPLSGLVFKPLFSGAIIDAVVYKGTIDCSANPNYPAADAGDLYVISVAGKIGGASGIDVTTGDTILCKTDGSLAGTQAAVGANWNVIQSNITYVPENPANKDASGGYAGLTLFKINFKNSLNTFTSFFTNANTAARTYLFQNRNGTIADDTDLATKQDKISALLTGGLITIETIDGTGTLNDIKVTASTYYIVGSGNHSAALTNFLNITNCSAGNFKSIGIFGKDDNTVVKVEGAEGTGATNPATPAGCVPFGYVIWGDAGAVGIPPVEANTYSLQFGVSAAITLSPADSTTYHFFTKEANVVSGNPATKFSRAFLVPRNGTLKYASLLIWVTSAIGSAELCPIYLEVYDTTNTIVSTTLIVNSQWNNGAGINGYAISGLNVPVTAGQRIIIKMVTPAWVTNPTTTWINGILYFE